MIQERWKEDYGMEAFATVFYMSIFLWVDNILPMKWENPNSLFVKRTKKPLRK